MTKLKIIKPAGDFTLTRLDEITAGTPSKEHFRLHIHFQAVEPLGRPLQELQGFALLVDLAQIESLVNQLRVELARMRQDWQKHQVPGE